MCPRSIALFVLHHHHLNRIASVTAASHSTMAVSAPGKQSIGRYPMLNMAFVRTLVCLACYLVTLSVAKIIQRQC